MRTATFAWFLKDRLMKSTVSRTLDLKLLANLAIRDEALRPLLTLYATAYFDRQQAGKRLKPEQFADYGKYYDPTGYPAHAVLADMPSAYRALYGAYHAYVDGRETRGRMKIRCRNEILRLMRERGISLRSIARTEGMNVGCVSRFLNGCDYAISCERLVKMIATLGGEMCMDIIQVKDYSERKLECGMVEITFALVMSDDIAAVLDEICKENSVTLSRLFQRFLYWLAENRDEATAWLTKAKGNETSTASRRASCHPYERTSGEDRIYL